MLNKNQIPAIASVISGNICGFGRLRHQQVAMASMWCSWKEDAAGELREDADFHQRESDGEQ